MAGPLEGGAQIGVIENFTVVGDPETAILVGHRLVAGGDIDNAEAAVAEGGEEITIKAGAVRAAGMDDAGHAGEQRVGRGVRGACDESCNAAHRVKKAVSATLLNSHTRWARKAQPVLPRSRED